jgi:hypothetical protein
MPRSLVFACTEVMPTIPNIRSGAKLIERLLWCAVSLNHRPDRRWRSEFEDQKNSNSQILRSTRIIVPACSYACSYDSHFLPFTHNPKNDSGGGARQDNYFFVAPSIALLLNKLRLVALYLLSNLAIYRFVRVECLSFVLKIH